MRGRLVPISKRNLNLLPDIEPLRRLLQSMAMLDAILCPEWDGRYWSFNAGWAKGQQMGSMRNGSGDEFFALFITAGCFIKGFAHESAMSPFRRNPKSVWPGIFESVPTDFASGLKEPAFSPDETTFCIWRRHSDKTWQVGSIEFPNLPDPDGSEYFLSCLDDSPETYAEWASDYYEMPVSTAAVRELYAHKPLTEVLVQQLNPETSLKRLAADIKEIGYPK